LFCSGHQISFNNANSRSSTCCCVLASRSSTCTLRNSNPNASQGGFGFDNSKQDKVSIKEIFEVSVGLRVALHALLPFRLRPAGQWTPSTWPAAGALH
jgi:hypothetical protein